MPAVRSVLVIGAGAAGTATAILLAEHGISVDLVDLKPDVGALGSGITLQGNALRVFRQLGVWDKIAERGYAFDSLGIRAPDPTGPRLSACIGRSWLVSSSSVPPALARRSGSTRARWPSSRTMTAST